MKILVLPLFQFPTGHTKVAETIQENIYQLYPDATIKMVDFLTFCNPSLEKSIGSLYMNWIRKAPSVYQFIYRICVNNDSSKSVRPKFRVLSPYFQRKMKKLIEKERPSLIVCTHAFPSNILGKLKQKQLLTSTPIVNVYTDFFLNDVWAKSEIDYHLVPHQQAKETLVASYNVDEDRIFVTGIPIHPSFQTSSKLSDSPQNHVLVAGGNTGYINADELLKLLDVLPSMHFTVLCGNNDGLYSSIENLHSPHISPLAYIECIEEMNALYNQVDAIITKPGGVTISEVLQKRIPIFVNNYLPGPEEVNLHFLLDNGIAREVSLFPCEIEKIQLLWNDNELQKMRLRMELYNREITCSVDDALSTILFNEFNYLPIPSRDNLSSERLLQKV